MNEFQSFGETRKKLLVAARWIYEKVGALAMITLPRPKGEAQHDTSESMDPEEDTIEYWPGGEVCVP